MDIVFEPGCLLSDRFNLTAKPPDQAGGLLELKRLLAETGKRTDRPVPCKCLPHQTLRIGPLLPNLFRVVEYVLNNLSDLIGILGIDQPTGIVLLNIRGQH